MQDAVGCTALHHAVTSQRTKSVMMLLAAGADPTLLNFRCFAPIHDAAGYGFLPYVTIDFDLSLSLYLMY